MGIRLAKEDELKGLDLTSIIEIFIHEKNRFVFFLAHGENWELTTTRKVSDLVKKILDDQDDMQAEAKENGTFELHYTPSDAKRQSFKIPISTPSQKDEQAGGQSKNSDVDRF